MHLRVRNKSKRRKIPKLYAPTRKHAKRTDSKNIRDACSNFFETESVTGRVRTVDHPKPGFSPGKRAQLPAKRTERDASLLASRCNELKKDPLPGVTLPVKRGDEKDRE